MRLLIAFLIAAAPAVAQQSNEELQKRVNDLCKDVADTLGVQFENEVPAAYQSREDFRKFVEASFEKEMPAEKRDALTRTYRLLGLVPKDFDLVKTIGEMMESQAAAYYDPETKKMYVLMSDSENSMLDMILFHELVHAVQDQEHDLNNTMKKLAEAGNDDAASAYRFLVEGEASFWMQAYMVEQQTGTAWEELPAMAKNMALGQAKNTTTKSIIQSMELQAKMMGDDNPDLIKAAEQIKNVPPIFVRSLVDPYMRGMYAASKLYDEGGAAAFRTQFKDDPPTNTRDMMFADDWMENPKRGFETVRFDDLAPVFGDGWTKLHEDTIGAVTLHTFFEDSRSTADKIAKGWQGDRVQTWSKGEDAVVCGRIVFANDGAAEAFVKNLDRLYREQWTSGKIVEHAGEFTHLSDGADHLLIQRKEASVVFARGALQADATKLVGALWMQGTGSTVTPSKNP